MSSSEAVLQIEWQGTFLICKHYKSRWWIFSIVIQAFIIPGSAKFVGVIVQENHPGQKSSCPLSGYAYKIEFILSPWFTGKAILIWIRIYFIVTTRVYQTSQMKWWSGCGSQMIEIIKTPRIDTLFFLFRFATAGFSPTMSLDYIVVLVVAATACFLGVNSQCNPGSVPATCELVILSLFTAHKTFSFFFGWMFFILLPVSHTPPRSTPAHSTTSIIL